MSRCWPEGALRAHLDRELAPEEMDRVAAHLGECAECARLSVELAARAERVGTWLEALPVPQLEWTTPVPRRANWSRDPMAGRRWIGLAAALAAGLVLAAWLLPHHRNAVTAPVSVVASAPPVKIAGPAIESPAVVAKPAHAAVLPRRVRRPGLLRLQPQARTVGNEFLALDDEPIETGVVMRVGVEPGNVQADIVFGPDGRAHAIRLVGGRN